MTRFTVVVGCTLLWCATGLAQQREEREGANQERPKKRAAPQKAQQNQRRNERARAVEPARRAPSPDPFDWESEYQKFLQDNPGVKKAVEAGKIAKAKVIAEIKERAAEKAAQAEREENRSLEAEFQQLLVDRPEVKERLESGEISKDQIMQRLRIGRQRRKVNPAPRAAVDWEAEYQKFLKDNPGVKKAVEAGKIAKTKVIAEIKERAAEQVRQAEREEERRRNTRRLQTERALEAEFQQLLKNRPELKERLESGEISKDRIMQRLRLGRQRRRDPAAAGARAAGGRGGGRGWSRLKESDSDGDGKISKDEAPENIKRFFDRMDKNRDGFIEQSEVGGSRGGGAGASQIALRTKLGELVAAGKLTRAEAGELYQIAFPRNPRPARGDRAPAERARERPQRGRRRGDREPDRDRRERRRDRDNDGDRARDDREN